MTAPAASPATVPSEAEPALRRADVHRETVVDGRLTRTGFRARAVAALRRATTSDAELREAELGQLLEMAPRPTRPHVIASVSPKGGVGKTTVSFAVGSVLASHAHLPVLAVDCNRDFGTLGSLAPDRVRAERSLADLLGVLGRIRARAELAPYVSRLPSGLDLLAAPASPQVMAELTPELYAEVLEAVAPYYDVILLDLGTGIVDSVAQLALELADQALVVTAPGFVTAERVLGALGYLREAAEANARVAELTLVVNRTGGPSRTQREIERAFERAGITRRVAIPEDPQLHLMLDSATYALEALGPSTRILIKRLGLMVAERLS